jgi:hypothetical protein
LLSPLQAARCAKRHKRYTKPLGTIRTTMDKMLTFEYSNSEERLELHLDEIGIRDLIGTLNSLLEQEGSDHEHLYTADWGGNDLTSEKMNNDNSFKLIKHVKIMHWKDNSA